MSMKMNRGEWIRLTEYSLNRIKNSSHDLAMKKGLDEFLEEVKKVMQNTLVEAST